MDVKTSDLIRLSPALSGTKNGLLQANYHLRAAHPINEGRGEDFYNQALAAPLNTAIPCFEERTDIALSGTFKEETWLARSGHLAGIFKCPLFGIPATGRSVFIRFGRFDRFVGEDIAETILLFDLPALMMQAGVWPLAPALGPAQIAPGPATRDGVADAPFPDVSGTCSLALVEGMIGGLMRYDGKLKTMGMRDFWIDDFWWYGPAPIGNFRGHIDYERGHQQPFLSAFPDRVGGNHAARVGERNYVASTGWPSITATHAGGDWLGLAPTGKAITMRVMDFWRCDGNRLAENWVMIDIPELLLQLGVDVFARMRSRLA
jgi:predicted ester cyclase